MVLAIIGVAIGTAYVITKGTTPVYQTSTTLYFAERPNSIPALDLLNQMETGADEVATEMEVMRSRALAAKVVDSLGLQVLITDPPGAVTSYRLKLLAVRPDAQNATFHFSKTPSGTYAVRDDAGSRLGEATVGRPFELGGARFELLPRAAVSQTFEVTVKPRAAAIDALQLAMKVGRPNPSASVVQITYASHDRAETKNVPDVLARAYLAWRASLRKTGDRSTVEFLRKQIDTISVQLYSAEESLRRFREANQVVDLPAQAESKVQRLAALEAQRADVNNQRTALNRLISGVKAGASDPRLGSPYRRLMAFPGLMTSNNPALPLLQTLTTLEERRTELLTRRTVNDPDVQSLTQAISDVESQIAAVVDTYLKGLDEQARSLDTAVGQFHTEIDQVPRREVEYARLDRTATGLTQIYTMLQTRLREAQIAEAVDDDAVRVVDPAAMPTRPIAPRPALNLLIGGVFGLLLAILAVMLRERLDRTIHTKDEVEAVTGGPVLAMIPHIGEATRAQYLQWWTQLARHQIRRSNGQPVRAAETSRLLLDDPQSVASEAFRKLRTNITFVRPDSPPRVLVFTSPAPADGKSTSVMNLAIVLVQQGKKVIVVDGDMRRGGLHAMLRGRHSPGLSEILTGQVDMVDSIQSLALETVGSIDLLSTGAIPPNPAELLASTRFASLVETLRTIYDVVLIDSPPINLVTDAAIISRESDGALLVARAAKTTRGELMHAVDQLRQVQVPLTGLILNDYSAQRDAGYYAPYYYGYRYDDKPYGARP